jgi:hypothetical protein
MQHIKGIFLASENGQAGSGVTDFLYDMSETRQ